MNIFLHLFNVREVFYVGSPLPFYHIICCSPPFQRVFGNILSALPPSIVSLCHGLVLRLFLRIVHLFLSVSPWLYLRLSLCLCLSVCFYLSICLCLCPPLSVSPSFSDSGPSFPVVPQAQPGGGLNFLNWTIRLCGSSRPRMLNTRGSPQGNPIRRRS